MDSEPGSLRTVRKDEGSQPVGGGDPPSRVPSSSDLTPRWPADGPPAVARSAKDGTASPHWSGSRLLRLVFWGLMNGAR